MSTVGPLFKSAQHGRFCPALVPLQHDGHYGHQSSACGATDDSRCLGLSPATAHVELTPEALLKISRCTAAELLGGPQPSSECQELLDEVSGSSTGTAESALRMRHASVLLQFVWPNSHGLVL